MSGAGWRSARPAPLPRRVEHPFWTRVLDSIALFFSGFCHTLGAAFLRLLSTVVLVAGVGGAVALNIMGYYYLGVLNPHPLIATLLYLPTLAALALLREEMLKNGTSPSGMGASRDSHAAALGYVLMIFSGSLSVLHPLWMRGDNYISGRSMWTCIGATALFFFSLLFSSLAYASALNIYSSGKRELRYARGDVSPDASSDYVALPFDDDDPAPSAQSPPTPAASTASASSAGLPAPPPEVYGDGKPSGPYDAVDEKGAAVVAAGDGSPSPAAIKSYYK